jgi:hypothetical protein
MPVASDCYVILKGTSLAIPAEPLRLLLELEERGFSLERDGDDLVVRPSRQLTAHDRPRITRWKQHLLTLMEYRAPEVS